MHQSPSPKSNAHSSAPISASQTTKDFTKSRQVVVIGAGAFGTAMALTCHRARHNVTFLTRKEEQAHLINTKHVSPDHHVRLPHDMTATTDFNILTQSDAAIVAIPAQKIPRLIRTLHGILPKHLPLILTSKGILGHDQIYNSLSDAMQTQKTLDTLEGAKRPPRQQEHHAHTALDNAFRPLFPRQLCEMFLENPISILGGPNFACEIVDNLPAAACLATPDQGLSGLFHHTHFRIYPTQDPVGIEVAGVVKNVLAIGCGMVSAAKLGSNTLAAIMTRGLAEMTRLGVKMGALEATFLGLGGVGDLILTCSSEKSRNFSLGMRVAQGESVQDILDDGHPLSEGCYSLQPLLELAAFHNIELPLCQAISDILDGTPLVTIMETLLRRPAPCV